VTDPSTPAPPGAVLEELLGALPARLWHCLQPNHSNVEWDGDVARCPDCGLTSDMTRRYRDSFHGVIERRLRRELAAEGGPARGSAPLNGRGDWMQTFTGRAFYPLAAEPADVDPADIAHALSLICRYGGHVKTYYSVAEHCVLMSRAVAPENALWALLHDATEAYMGDMIRPLKRAMPAYAAAEDRLMAVICARFGLDPACPPEVKAADNRILHDERDALLTAAPLPWSAIESVPPLGVPVEGWPPEVAEREYLGRLADLVERDRRTALVDHWNRDHPAGTPVRIWPGSRPEGRHIDTVTDSRAWMLGGHTPVVRTAGYRGGIALTHVQVLDARNEPEEGTDG